MWKSFFSVHITTGARVRQDESQLMKERIKIGHCLKVCGMFLAAVVISGCSGAKVDRFLSSASDRVNSYAGTVSDGDNTTANQCRPNAYHPTVADPVPYLVGKRFIYQRGEYHRGKVSYSADGSFSWQNMEGTKSGTGNWSVNGKKWCESYNASAHNEAVSARCWPVTTYRGAVCFGISRLTPDHG